MDLGNELKQLVDDGIFDWMNESIAHNPSALPRHCIDTNGGLRKDLLHRKRTVRVFRLPVGVLKMGNLRCD